VLAGPDEQWLEARRQQAQATEDARIRSSEAERKYGLTQQIAALEQQDPTAGIGNEVVDPSDALASSLAFGRAKDQAGLATRGLLKSVRHNMASRGIGGSGIEGAASLDTLAGGADRVSQAATTEAVLRSRRAKEVADRNFGAKESRRRQQKDAIARLREML
jgi:hypothetical protein